jgi:outer membrane protein TolC
VGISQLSMSQADSTDIEIMRAELVEEKHEMMLMLTNMLGETPEVTLLPVEMAAWEQDAAQTYPVVIAAADIDMARKDVDLRESEFNPNFEVQANYGRMNGGDNAGTIMVGLSIPLWASESQRPRLEGAKASVRAAESDQESIKRQTIEKLNHLKAQVETSSRKIELLKRKESLLGASSGAQTREYEAGKADFAMPLKTRRDMLSVRYQLAAERAKHTALVADFNRYIIQGDSK